MKHAVIVAHPRRNSFTLAVAEAWAEAARAAGAEAVVRDLYRMGFDPLLHEDELPDHEGYAPRPDVVEERRVIGDADAFVLVYPLWFNATPAMLKGYLDRVFGLGFGYSPQSGGGNRPLLPGRLLVSFTSSGAPQHWVESSGAWAAMQAHFDRHLADVCGFEIAGRYNFGGVHAGIREDAVAQRLEEVRARATELVRRMGGRG